MPRTRYNHSYKLGRSSVCLFLAGTRSSAKDMKQIGIDENGLVYEVESIDEHTMTALCQSHPTWGPLDGWHGWLRCRFERFEYATVS